MDSAKAGLAIQMHTGAQETSLSAGIFGRTINKLISFGGIMAPKSKKWKSIGKVAGTLLAATCLTVASGTAARANSVTYTEGTGSLSGDFSNTAVFTSGNTMAAAAIPGTTTVIGDLTQQGQIINDNSDWFELTGLGTGTFTADASAKETDLQSPSINFPVTVSIYSDSSPTALETQTFDTGLTTASFNSINIPSDGNLEFNLTGDFSGGSEGSGSLQYTVDVYSVKSASTPTPEPPTLEMLGMGLMGAFGFDLMRRKKKQQEEEG